LIGTPHLTASEYAYEAIKSLIINGTLAPGSKIDQDELANSLNLSRMPLRSAFEHLAAEGLVENTPRRGVSVAAISAKNINDVFTVRCQMESLALVLAMQHMTADDVQNVSNLLDKQVSVENPDLDTTLEQNYAFHYAIFSHCENDLLIRMLESIWAQCERYRRIFYRQPNSLERFRNEHRELINLIASGDVQSASDFMIKHTRRSQKALLRILDEPIPKKLVRTLVL